MAKVTIDGRSIEVDAGTTVLRAAKQLGIEIPTFCYHPGLTIPANCRMCLVEVEKVPKPLPACYTQVSEGMVVHTRSERTVDAQKAVLEFILLNHPVDCPICDQAGECVLQEHFQTWSAKPSRLFHSKVAKEKAVHLGPRVVLDKERCIICTRCVRFCEEVAKQPELTVEDRGDHSEISTFPGRQLENPYSLNVVDICPVGALTDSGFRFKRRVWFLDKRNSVCTGCSRLCSSRLDSTQNRAERMIPRYNPDVNQWWMCDDGRDMMRQRTRVVPPVARNGETDSTVAAAVDALAVWCAEAAELGGEIGVALSASLTNEDLYAWGKLVAAIGARPYLVGRDPWQGDDLLRRDDRDCNGAGAAAILNAIVGPCGDAAALAGDAASLHAVLLLDNEVGAAEALVGALAAHPRFAVLSDVDSPFSEAAEVVVPISGLHHRDGTLVGFDGRVQRLLAPLTALAGTMTPAEVAARIGAGLQVELAFAADLAPESIFERLAAEVEAFRNLNYTEIGDLGRPLTHGGDLAPRRDQLDGTSGWEPDPVHPTAQRPFALRRGC